MGNKKIYFTPLVEIAKISLDVITASTIPAVGTDDIGDWEAMQW